MGFDGFVVVEYVEDAFVAVMGADVLVFVGGVGLVADEAAEGDDVVHVNNLWNGTRMVRI